MVTVSGAGQPLDLGFANKLPFLPSLANFENIARMRRHSKSIALNIADICRKSHLITSTAGNRPQWINDFLRPPGFMQH
jgi:hypothetical protein